LKNHKTFAHLIKGIVLGRTLWGANTFPTRNRLPDQNSGFSQTLLFLWFSIVSYNNYGGDSKLCFLSNFFLFAIPSRFWLRQLDMCGSCFLLPMDCLGSLRTCPKCNKPVALTLFVWCLAVRGESLGDSGQTKATTIVRRLAARVVPPGDYCQTMALLLSGAWRREGSARRSTL